MTHADQTYIGPEAIVTKRREYGYPCTANFYKEPPQIISGKKHKLYGHDGKAYVDFFTGCRLSPAATAMKLLRQERSNSADAAIRQPFTLPSRWQIWRSGWQTAFCLAT